QFGTVEDLLARTGELTGKLKENVEKNRELAVISKKLAMIHCEVPCPVDFEKLKLQPFDDEKLKGLFVEFEFNSIGRRLFGDEFKAGRGFAGSKPAGGATGAAPGRPAVQEDFILVADADQATTSDSEPSPASPAANL